MPTAMPTNTSTNDDVVLLAAFVEPSCHLHLFACKILSVRCPELGRYVAQPGVYAEFINRVRDCFRIRLPSDELALCCTTQVLYMNPTEGGRSSGHQTRQFLVADEQEWTGLWLSHRCRMRCPVNQLAFAFQVIRRPALPAELCVPKDVGAAKPRRSGEGVQSGFVAQR